MRLLLRPERRWRDIPHFVLPYELRATGCRVLLNTTNGLIVLALLGSPALSEVELAEIRWPEPDDMPDTWAECLHVQICRINALILSAGVRITGAQRHYKLVEINSMRVAA